MDRTRKPTAINRCWQSYKDLVFFQNQIKSPQPFLVEGFSATNSRDVINFKRALRPLNKLLSESRLHWRNSGATIHANRNIICKLIWTTEPALCPAKFIHILKIFIDFFAPLLPVVLIHFEIVLHFKRIPIMFDGLMRYLYYKSHRLIDKKVAEFLLKIFYFFKIPLDKSENVFYI